MEIESDMSDMLQIGEEVVRATLSPGDYFGGHTLTTDRTNVASIVAGRGGPSSAQREDDYLG